MNGDFSFRCDPDILGDTISSLKSIIPVINNMLDKVNQGLRMVTSARNAGDITETSRVKDVIKQAESVQMEINRIINSITFTINKALYYSIETESYAGGNKKGENPKTLSNVIEQAKEQLSTDKVAKGLLSGAVAATTAGIPLTSNLTNIVEKLKKGLSTDKIAKGLLTGASGAAVAASGEANIAAGDSGSNYENNTPSPGSCDAYSTGKPSSNNKNDEPMSGGGGYSRGTAGSTYDKESGFIENEKSKTLTNAMIKDEDNNSTINPNRLTGTEGDKASSSVRDQIAGGSKSPQSPTIKSESGQNASTYSKDNNSTINPNRLTGTEGDKASSSVRDQIAGGSKSPQSPTIRNETDQGSFLDNNKELF